MENYMFQKKIGQCAEDFAKTSSLGSSSFYISLHEIIIQEVENIAETLLNNNESALQNSLSLLENKYSSLIENCSSRFNIPKNFFGRNEFELLQQKFAKQFSYRDDISRKKAIGFN